MEELTWVGYSQPRTSGVGGRQVEPEPAAPLHQLPRALPMAPTRDRQEGSWGGRALKQVLPLPPVKNAKALWEITYLKFSANTLIGVQTLARAHC